MVNLGLGTSLTIHRTFNTTTEARQYCNRGSVRQSATHTLANNESPLTVDSEEGSIGHDCWSLAILDYTHVHPSILSLDRRKDQRAVADGDAGVRHDHAPVVGPGVGGGGDGNGEAGEPSLLPQVSRGRLREDCDGGEYWAGRGLLLNTKLQVLAIFLTQWIILK